MKKTQYYIGCLIVLRNLKKNVLKDTIVKKLWCFFIYKIKIREKGYYKK